MRNFFFFLSAYFTYNMVYIHMTGRYNVHALSHIPFHRLFLYSESKSRVNLVFRSATAWFSYVFLRLAVFSASARTSHRTHASARTSHRTRASARTSHRTHASARTSHRTHASTTATVLGSRLLLLAQRLPCWEQGKEGNYNYQAE